MIGDRSINLKIHKKGNTTFTGNLHATKVLGVATVPAHFTAVLIMAAIVLRLFHSERRLESKSTP